MAEYSKHGMIRTRRTQVIALVRLFDIAITGLTLKLLLDLSHLEFGYYQVWWLVVASLSFEFFAEFNFLYTSPRGTNLYIESLRTGLSWAGVALVCFIVATVQPAFIQGYETQFWIWLLLVPVELITWHLITRLIINYFRSIGKNTRRVAIIGATSIGEEIERTIKNENWLGFYFMGYYDDRIKQEAGRLQAMNKEIAGNVQALMDKVREHRIDIIYITLPLRSENRIKQILEILSDAAVTVYYVPDLFVFDLLRSKIENLNGIPIISIYDTPFYGVDGFVKRLFDIIISSIVLIIIAIPLILVAIGVKLSSPGPVLFKQRRYGFRGEEIVVWKFRSMKVTEDGEKVTQATKNDPRVTRFGNFIRRTSIDELPQFINVLQGRMSIIGPRPHAVAHNEFYRGQIKGYMLRHRVKPGITGLAQINGYRGETDTIEKMDGRIRYDLEYIRNWSLLLDLKIFFLTIIKGFVGKQAY